jgi:hypothetical protein
MEALKAEKERSEEEKQRIAEQLLQQHLELQSHYQVSTCFIFSFWLFSHKYSDL